MYFFLLKEQDTFYSKKKEKGKEKWNFVSLEKKYFLTSITNQYTHEEKFYFLS